MARLLLELPQRGRQRVLALVVLTLGNRPDALVLPGPERAAGMDEQDLDVLSAATVQQDPGAPLGHGNPLSTLLTFTLVSGSTVIGERRTDANRGARPACWCQRPLDPVLRAAGPAAGQAAGQRLPRLRRGRPAARPRDPLAAGERVRPGGDPTVHRLPARRHPGAAGLPRWHRRLPAEARGAGLPHPRAPEPARSRRRGAVAARRRQRRAPGGNG